MSDAIRRARDLLCDVTPLAVDCGQVCDGRCCRMSAESQGMLLFPGEEALSEEFVCVPAAGGHTLLTCDGRCDRATRPLACRMFPLFPHVDAQGRVRAVYDPRGFRMCPLTREQAHVPLERGFVRAVRRAGRILMRDAACAAFLREQSEEIDVLNRLLPLAEARAPIMRRNIRDAK